MKQTDISESIGSLVHDPAYKPMSQGEIAAKLSLKGKEKKMLPKVLSRMVRHGDIVVMRGNRYALGDEADLVSGCISIVRSGDGFLSLGAAETDIRILKSDLGTALPGDVVVVRLYPGGGRPSRGRRKSGGGKVIKVLERGRHRIVGTLKTTGSFFYVVPVDPSYSRDFYVDGDGGAKLDDRVVVEFVNWENKHVNPEGRIVEVIGPSDMATLDTLAVMKHYGYEKGFEAEVVADAERSLERVKRPGQRLDLRDRFIFTIDPVRARDFDDALSLDIDDKGMRILGVHIADVSHFVRPNTPLDEEARRRGNSVYFPDTVIPMLPEKLSNGICSLVPYEDRLAFSVFLTIDERGKVVDRSFAKSIIHSKLRLTYEQAFAALKSKAGKRGPAGMSDGQVELLKQIQRIAGQFRSRRMRANALDLDMPEYEIVTGGDGLVTDVKLVENDISHQLVEECMVAANEAVDAELSSRGRGLIHRIHEPPSKSKIEELQGRLAEMGFQPGDLSNRRNLANFLKSASTSPLIYHVRVAVLRSMMKAVYSPEAKGHYGLSKKFYAHFTSPIRRYPDLVVHRALGALLSGKKGHYSANELTAISRSCSETERDAEQAERSVIEIKTYRYLQHELESGDLQERDAVVVRVTNFGMFVELVELRIQGLIHISAISRGMVKHIPGKGVLRAGKRQYKIGMAVKVLVCKVDFENRRVDFALASQAEGGRSGSKKRSPRKNPRKQPRGSRGRQK